MSAFPHFADSSRTPSEVREVPLPDSCIAAKETLLDDLVGSDLQRLRHCDAERFRGPKIDHQFKPCRLYNRQLSGFGAFEDLRCVVAYLAKPLGNVASMRCHLLELHRLVLYV